MTAPISAAIPPYVPPAAPSVLERLKQVAILVAKVFIQILFPLISTMLVAPFVPSIVTAIVAVGTSFLSSLLFQEETVARPRSRIRGLQEGPPLSSGAPRGLERTGNACWVISALQIARRFLTPLLARDCPERLRPLRTFLESYAATRGNVCEASPYELWCALREKGVPLDDPGTQGDPSQFLESVLDVLGVDAQTAPMRTTVTLNVDAREDRIEIPEGTALPEGNTREQNRSVNNGFPLIQLHIPPENPAPHSLNEMLRRYLHEGIDPESPQLYHDYIERAAAGGERETVRAASYPILRRDSVFLREPPSHLFITAQRWSRLEGAATVKRSDLIDFPETLTIPVENGDVTLLAELRLESVLVHRGEDAGHGHYVCFVRGEDGNFYFCDDDQVVPIDQATWERGIQNGYIACYRRIEEGEALREPTALPLKPEARAPARAPVATEEKEPETPPTKVSARRARRDPRSRKRSHLAF